MLWQFKLKTSREQVDFVELCLVGPQLCCPMVMRWEGFKAFSLETAEVKPNCAYFGEMMARESEKLQRPKLC